MERTGCYPYLAHKAAGQVDELEEKLAQSYVGAAFTTGFAILGAAMAYFTDDPIFADVETASAVVMGLGALYFFRRIPKLRSGLETLVSRSDCLYNESRNNGVL